MSPEEDITPVYGNGFGILKVLSFPRNFLSESAPPPPVAFNSAEIVPVPVIGEGET